MLRAWPGQARIPFPLRNLSRPVDDVEARLPTTSGLSRRYLQQVLERLFDVADNRNLLWVTDEQREELERWAQSRTLPASDVFRARLILALADGFTYRDIEKKVGT